MIGKEAWEYIEANRHLISSVTFVDIEYGKLKCFYEIDINEVTEKWFKDDEKNWQEKNYMSYGLLYEVKFEVDDEIIQIEKVYKPYYQELLKLKESTK